MAKFRAHKLVAAAVLLATAAWVATGEFTSVGSAADEAAARAAQAQEPVAPPRSVAVTGAVHVGHARAIRVSGRTEADKRATLATRAGGVVEELPVRLGSRVSAGEIILKLEAEGKEAAVETARQLLVQREAEADAARRLVERESMPRLQLDNALSALASARSQLEAAVAELDRNIVRAPFDGLIDRIDVELGSAVASGAPVAVLLDLDPVLVIGEVSERDLAHIRPGGRADMRLVDGVEATGEIRHVSRDASAATRTFRVEAAFDNADGAIPAGMTAEITFRAEPADAVVLPRSVVTLSDEGELGVRAADHANRVVFHPVELLDDTQQGLVLAGIPAGARVIVSGQDLVSDGDVVDPVEIGPAEIGPQALGGS